LKRRLSGREPPGIYRCTAPWADAQSQQGLNIIGECFDELA
jgi:hypothetical protein